jgi:aryl-alcohol dehydrogenase-like predicted oxidoreductase
MDYRLLGRTGLRVSELFLGAMTFDDRDTAAAIIDRYAEAGGNVIDTAVNYGDGVSERLLGELLAGRRERFVLATKYTCSRDVTNPNAAGNHRANLTRSLETSLRQLRTDHLDLFWVHVWDRHTPIEETMRALDDAVRAGKILYTGISDAPAWLVSRANTLAEWRDWTPFAGLQVPYNLLKRDVERDLIPMAEALGISVAAWGPLAGGVLSGRFDGPNPAPGNRNPTIGVRELAVTTAVRQVAGELGATPAQVSLAWLMSRPGSVHPLIGVSSVAQLDDNLGAVGLTLPAAAVERLDTATEFDVGFPVDFVTACEDPDQWVFGAAAKVVSAPGTRR